MKRNKAKINILLVICFFIVFSLFFNRSILAANDYSSEIEKTQKQIEEQQNYIKKLEEQRAIYQKNIEIKRGEATTLNSQLSILNNQIARTKVEIQTKEAEIKNTDLMIKNIQYKILEKQKQIESEKEKIAELLRLIYYRENKNYLEIILLNNSISDILVQLKYLEDLQTELSQNLDKVKLIKQGLEMQEKDLRSKKDDLTKLKNELTEQKLILGTKKETKQNLLDETRGAEWKFQSLLADAIKEQRLAESEIARLEQSVRAKIAQQEREEKLKRLEAEGTIVFSWPVPSNAITATFHDPDYPYKNWLGEHPGIDIRAAQRTAIRAPAAGYVAKAKSGGMGYSYIMLIHNDSFSTVYGHLNEILVQEDTYVKRGEIIGRTGGLPGTPGAGRFSTGPHLHFEVRLNGVPVNPLDYLI